MTLSPEPQQHRYTEWCAALAAQSPAARRDTLRALCAAGTEAPQVLFLLQWRWGLPPEPDRDRSGECIGRFTLCEPLAEGGGGIVYRAEQPIGPHRREVAVKLLHPTLLQTAREEALARFLAEMGLLVQLEHDGIARIYDGGLYEDPYTHDQLPYIAMELVRGGLPLTTYAQDYALAWPERLALVLRVCRAIQYAHEHRVVHRDLKPANILVDPEGRPVVIDFGVACASDALLPGAPRAAFGTPAYMSPEQVSDAFGAVSAKSDVYALGLILYELLTEQLPYRLPPGGVVETWSQVIVDATPRPLRQYNAAYSEELDAIVAAALAKRPADRLAVAVLRSRLERYLQTLPSARDWPRQDTRQAPRDLQAEAPLPPVLPAPAPALPPALDTLGGSRAVPQGRPDAERRQVTLLFCDLVGSTALSGQLDPEDLREVLQAYRETCAVVIARYGGNVDKFLGDGTLVCFGYPQAHDDDPQRAVRAGLEIVVAIARENPRLTQTWGGQLAVRIGIHTGLVVAGELGRGATRDPQAIVGEAPNLAARLQDLAAPNTVVCSAATARLVEGYFTLEALGPQGLKGVATPVSVYRVVGESGAQTRFDVATARGLTPLVGREVEVALLRDRWAQVTEGLGQVVCISGEAGIGKSRLVQVLKDHVANELHVRWECRGSPYYHYTAFYPLIDLWERALHFQREETAAAKLAKLEQALTQYRLPLDETVPLLAALLALPLPAERYRPLAGTPQQQKQHTMEALLAMVLERAAQHPVLLIIEDLHWVDPSTLEFLTLLLDQGPTAAVLTLLTCRPEFQPPWGVRSHCTPLVLHRLLPAQVRALVAGITGGKALPPDVTREVVTKTDGVPLFVEELTKMVLEAGWLRAQETHYELSGPLPPLAIPPTLHDSLMARLDRLATVKEVAQLGATIGRTFAYELLQAVSPLDDATLQHGLRQLVEAELVYQRGLPPQATYTFKHALIQDAAYQSLLRSMRQQVHQRIAQVLVERFPDIVAAQPELVGYHYTEAGDSEHALSWWQRAGQRALERSALVEAIAHFTTGLQLLDTLPDIPERARQELALRAGLGVPLSAIKGPGAPEVFDNYGRARQLCHDIAEAPEHYQVLWGAWRSHLAIAQLEAAQELADQLVALAQREQDAGLLLEAHHAQWTTLSRVYEPRRCWHHAEQGMALYQPERHHNHVFTISDHDAGVCCRGFGALSLWQLGHLDQALTHSRDAVALARQLSHPTSLAHALTHATWLLQLRRDLDTGLERAEEIVAVAAEYGFAQYLATAAILKGWLLTRRGQGNEGLALMRQGLSSGQAKGTGPSHAYFLYLLAEAHLQVGEARLGLVRLIEALDEINRVGTRAFEPEMHRVHGELLCVLPDGDEAEAAACFHQAIAMAQAQNARTLELRAAIRLARLWQQQGKRADARDLLAPIYGWFTEGFDTADLQDAKALLEALGG